MASRSYLCSSGSRPRFPRRNANRMADAWACSVNERMCFGLISVIGSCTIWKYRSYSVRDCSSLADRDSSSFSYKRSQNRRRTSIKIRITPDFRTGTLSLHLGQDKLGISIGWFLYVGIRSSKVSEFQFKYSRPFRLSRPASWYTMLTWSTSVSRIAS